MHATFLATTVWATDRLVAIIKTKLMLINGDGRLLQARAPQWSSTAARAQRASMNGVWVLPVGCDDKIVIQLNKFGSGELLRPQARASRRC